MKKKALVAAILTIALCLLPFLESIYKHTVEAEGNIRVEIEGVQLQLTTPPFIENQTTLVPVREIAEALHAKVTYSEFADRTKTVQLDLNENNAVLTIDSKSMLANGKKTELLAAPRIVKSVTMVPIRAISEALGTIVTWDKQNRTISITKSGKLPTINSTKKLLELLQHSDLDMYGRVAFMGDIVTEVTSSDSKTSTQPTVDSNSAGSPSDDYSQTNVQVDGVDEADWAKTDGQFIYQISDSRVLISDISIPDTPKLSAELKYSAEENFQPLELYVDNNQLLVIGQQDFYPSYITSKNQTNIEALPDVDSTSVSTKGDTDKKAVIGSLPPILTASSVKTYIYKLNDKGEPTLTRELVQDGNYLSSRKIDNSLYIVTNKHSTIYPFYDRLMTTDPSESLTKKERKVALEQLTDAFEPIYSDSAISTNQLAIPLDEIQYFPESSDSSMMLIGSIDLNDSKQHLQISAYLGSGKTIYASKKHLYIALPHYKETGDSYKQETQFHKFRLDQGSVIYIGTGAVPGSLLNQFSMDEHEGYFRVALTKGDMWASGEDGSTNNIYILDESLTTVGKLEGLAPGERIYSTRFMGNRAYMVTFRNIDPLFSIDLSNPTKPAVLGQLKIPGYSDYLHPYDENHLIGFGVDTIEVPSKGPGGDNVTAFTQGLKLALFDVSDVNNPKEKFKEIIGDRGTSSELLRDHKALLFSKEKGIMAFPVQLHEVKNKEGGTANDFPQYGEFTYQGAYVYGIDLKSGFKLRGRISHLSEEDMKKSGQYGFDYRKSVKRILYAGDTIYTLSEALLKANDMNSLNERGSLAYPSLPK